MTLPPFRTLASRRHAAKQEDEGVSPTRSEDSSEHTVAPTAGIDFKIATKTRKHTIVASCVFFVIATIFLTLTLIGSINTKPVIRSTYLFKLDLTNIIPASPGDVRLASSLARSLGLHDFYQVGLWNFCEGYNDEGITFCAKPKTLWWFNPVAILLNELLAGATIALPADINTILNLIKIASHVMFSFFLAGTLMNVVSIFITPVVLYSRWWSFPIAVWTFIAALMTTTASVIGTVMAIIFKNVITAQPGLNIGASLGIVMLVFMWIGTGFTLLGFGIHLGLCCCCASRRDVKTGRRKGNRAAYSNVSSNEKKHTVNRFGMSQISRLARRRRAGQAV